MRSKDSSFFWSLAVALSLTSILASLTASPLAAQESKLEVLPAPGPQRGTVPPDFAWTSVDGEILSRDGMVGKVVLLDFWASWCAPCLQAVPHLKQLEEKHSDDVFQLIGINVDNEKAKLESWVAEQGLTWPQIWDRGHEVIRTFQVNNFPTYILLDHQGRVSYSTTGFSFTTSRLLDYYVGAAVQAAQAARAAREREASP